MTRFPFPTVITFSNVHSIWALASATRGGVIFLAGAGVSPAKTNSSSSEGTLAPVVCNWLIRSWLATFTTNSPVASMFLKVSFIPIELNTRYGGQSATKLKYECGARLRQPWQETVETHATGRGTTR